jgi:biopolymer transport protein ExbD
MITRPLDLESRLSPPPRDLDFMAWVNVGMMVLFFGLFGSRFVLAPGPLIDVTGQSAIEVPHVGTLAEGAGVASVVVSYRRDNVILFEGGMYSLADLRKHLEGYAAKHPGAVMLVRSDRQVSVQDILKLCEMAKSVGFAYVQLAAEPQEPASPSI